MALEPHTNQPIGTLKSRRPGHKIRVTADGIRPQDVRIYLDGVELNRYTQFKLEIGVGKLNKATIELFAGEVEIDARTMAILQANVIAPATVEEPPSAQ